VITIRPYTGQITQPGIYSGVPMSAYHGPSLCDGPSISSSGLRKIFTQSALHYWDQCPYNPDAESQDETDALILGRGAHHALLGEADFAKHFIMRPAELDGEPWQGNRKVCKQWLKDRAEEGMTVLTAAMRDQIRGMAKGLARNALLSAEGGVRMLDGLIEHTIVWRDEETGVWLKTRPDAIPINSDEVADLKTAVDVTDEKLQKTVAAYALNMQGALVGMAWREVFKRDMASFSLVFIEKTRPHVSKVKTIKPHDLTLGENQIRAALRTFKHCWDAKHWPGPGGDQTDAEFIEMNDWDRKRATTRIEALNLEIAA
jgi:hypothetical protein